MIKEKINMIIYPSIDTLLDRIPSRYSLAVLAAKRAHELEQGGIKMLPEYKSLKKKSARRLKKSRPVM